MTPLPHQNLPLLRIYLYYRSLLAVVLAGMFFTGTADNILGTHNPELFFWASALYVVICCVTIVMLPVQRLMHSMNLLIVSLVIDVAAVVLMLHSSGGVESGLGYLLLVYIAIASIFIRGQLAIAFAAMASLLVIAESLYLLQIDQASSRAIFSAGSLGILLFLTAVAFQFLTEKIRASNLEAAAQAEFAQHLQKLAQAIVARMRTGIIVIDDQGMIELINQSALQLLDLPQQVDYRNLTLDEIATLKPLAENWQDGGVNGPPTVLELRAGQQARVSMALVDLGTSARTVFYLEDHRVMTQQAQQMKLASLGRLTASIAHEIRNPLGALSHAAQLLAESPDISAQDKRLTDIIHQHSSRVNDIVESTLALSRRKEPKAETLNLSAWLPSFVTQFSQAQDVQIDLEISRDHHLIKMDPIHLSQVLTNLIDNGLRYSREATGRAKVLLLVEESVNDDRTYLEVIDDGTGIAPERLSQIFDPFYTTDKKGSGLGLYISRELCEINQATLHYAPTPDGKSCFRIDFTHHQRMF